MPDKPEAVSAPDLARLTPEVAQNVLNLLRRTTIQWDEMDAAIHARVALEAVALGTKEQDNGR